MANAKSKGNGRNNYKPRNKRAPKKKSSVNSTEEASASIPFKNGVNDPEWYKYNDTMFKGVISMPTLDFKGVDAVWPVTQGSTATDGKLKAPTVIAYYMNPSMGAEGSDFASGSVNIMARKIYAELSASNAKTSGYAPQDVATLLLSLGQVIALGSYFKRFYGILNYYNFYNRTIPKALLSAHGLDEAGVERSMLNMADIRNRINQVIARIDSIHFPGSLNYFKKCEYVYNNVFVDRDDAMATFMLMLPFSTWQIDEESFEEGTILKTKNLCNGLTSPYGQINLWSDMVDEILTSSTFNFIFSDVINLVNRNVISSDYIHIDMLESDYTVTPIYSEQFNWQIMNATICGEPATESVGLESTPSNDVYPMVDLNCLRYQPEFEASNSQRYRTFAWMRPIRLPDTDISDDDFVELLAYYNLFTVVDSTPGSETAYANGLSDYYVVNVKCFGGKDCLLTDAKTFNAQVVNNSADSMVNLGILLNVVHAPLMSIQANNTPPIKEAIMSKLGAYTFTNERMLRNLRKEVFLGLFHF